MFTLNWYKSIASTMATNTVCKYKNLSGTEYPMTSASMLGIGSGSTSSYGPQMGKAETSLEGSGGVIFGTGTTPPTIEDYKLSGDLITGFSAKAKVTREADDSGVTLTGFYTIINNSGTEMTIGEVGIIAPLHASYYNHSGVIYKGLLERTVLDSPVTIPANGVGQVTYTIRFNYPVE